MQRHYFDIRLSNAAIFHALTTQSHLLGTSIYAYIVTWPHIYDLISIYH